MSFLHVLLLLQLPQLLIWARSRQGFIAGVLGSLRSPELSTQCCAGVTNVDVFSHGLPRFMLSRAGLAFIRVEQEQTLY